jgi:hypothetical protein
MKETIVKKLISLAAVAVFALAFAAPTLAGDASKEVKLTGYITDEWCGAKNANAEGVGCAKACAKKGSDMAIYSDGKLYKLSDKEAALKHLGVKVQVTGTLNEEGTTVQVTSIEQVKEKA